MTASSPQWQMSERDLQDAVIECARLLGWKVAHFRAAQTGRGWRTPVQADAAGFPDLLMLRRGRILAVELKSLKGRMSAAQDMWLEAFRAAGATVAVFTPTDWLNGTVEAALRQERT